MKPMPPDHDPDDTGRGLSVGDPVRGKSRLLSRQCTTCIFRPGNRMHLDGGRLRDLVAQARAAEGFIVCHSTLPHYRYPHAKPAICRGFADRYTTQALQVIARLWGFVEVDPPGDASTAEPRQDVRAVATDTRTKTLEGPHMDGIEEFARRQKQLIDQFGWAVTNVFPTEDDPVSPFSYTVGLTAHGYPELIIAGLDPATSQALLNDLAARVYDRAERFTTGQRITDLLAGYEAVIVEGPATDALYPGAALARYGQDAVSLQQIVWPDPQGRYPWDTGYAYGPHVQPVLGKP
jgi:hypothetical protein